MLHIRHTRPFVTLAHSHTRTFGHSARACLLKSWIHLDATANAL